MGVGFCLRPGYGDPGDEVDAKNCGPSLEMEGHLPKGQPISISVGDPLAPCFNGLEDGRQSDLIQRQKKISRTKKENPNFKGAGAELWRMVCSMEIMGPKDKRKLGKPY